MPLLCNGDDCIWYPASRPQQSSERRSVLAVCAKVNTQQVLSVINSSLIASVYLCIFLKAYIDYIRLHPITDAIRVSVIMGLASDQGPKMQGE